MNQTQTSPVVATPTSPQDICSVCHIPLLPTYYFCPNCGKQIHEPPLPTGFSAQLSLYLFSILLPFIAFLFVTRWKGFKYLRQENTQAKVIGLIATLLLFGTTFLSFWYAYHLTVQVVQSTMSDVNSALGSVPGLQ